MQVLIPVANLTYTRRRLLNNTLASLIGMDVKISDSGTERLCVGCPVYHQPIGGPFNRAATINAGVRELITDPYFMVCDGDVLLTPEILDTVYKLLRIGTSYLLGATRYSPEVVYMCGYFGIQRDIFDSVGGFDTGYVGWGAEDDDFTIRIREQGTGINYCMLAATHQEHSPLARVSHLVERNRARLRSKYSEVVLKRHFDEVGCVIKELNDRSQCESTE